MYRVIIYLLSPCPKNDRATTQSTFEPNVDPRRPDRSWSMETNMQASRTMKIAVAGATGRVGRHIFEVLEGRGHEVVAMSRGQGVDVVTGAGLAQALTGVEAIIDAATGPSPDEKEATDF